MKPKTKFQIRVVEASAKLPKITDKQIQWGLKNTLEPVGQRTAKGVITCTVCAHKWQSDEGDLINALCGCECPACKTKLKVKTTRERVFSNSAYFTVITVCEGFQVVRTLMLKSRAKVGEKVTYTHAEVMQRWIAPDGKCATFALLRQTMGTMYVDSWLFHTSLELRNENANNKFYVNVYDRIGTGVIYPVKHTIPELKKRCFNGQFHRIKPVDLFRALLTDSKVETLLKAGLFGLLKHFHLHEFKTIDKYWPSIRIALRNGYKIENASDWCDYIDLLRESGKDLTNSVYVCPADFKAAHDKYVAKRNRQRAAEQARRDAEHREHERLAEADRKKWAKNQEVEFFKDKGKFFGLVFSDGTITVRVLESIAEYKEEGEAMHHCVGSYYKRSNSLVLSASIDGNRIETIEVSLTCLEVIQSRGVCNNPTPHHDQIIDLVGRNMPLIAQRLAA